MDIDNRISELLFLKDCVVIPGLGAFVSRYTPARIREESQTIIPPAKKFLFNRMLIRDDGELSGYLARYLQIDIGFARKAVEDYSEKLHAELAAKGRYYIKSVGELKYARTGELIFNPEEGVNFLTDAYGLSSIQFSRIARLKEHPLARRALQKGFERESPSQDPALIVRKIKTARRIAVAIPLLIAISLLPLNSRFGSEGMQSIAGFFSMPSLPVNELAIDETGVKSTGGSSPAVLNESEMNAGQVFDRDSYAIVAGSFSSRENAEELHSRLASKGYYNEIWEASNGFFRVVVQAHDKLSEAKLAAAALKEELEGIEPWILQ